MASRKEQKEQARAARVAQEQAAAAKAQRTRRYQIFGGVIAIAVIVIVVAVVVSSGGGGKGKNTSTGLPSGSKQQQIVAAVEKELAGIPQHGNTLGKPNAPVTLTYFGDLQCPVCAAFSTGADYEGQPPPGGLPEFIQKQVKPGHVKIVYASMCTASCNNPSFKNPEQVFDTQQVAAYAAGEQNKLWNYIELFYHEQGTEDTGYVTESFLQGIAKQVKGLNFAKWKTDRGNPALLSQVTSEVSTATKENLPGTPSLIMTRGSKSTLVNGGNFSGYSDLTSALQEVS